MRGHHQPGEVSAHYQLIVWINVSFINILVCVSQNLGQWSTAQFDSSDQQKKFLRLMGGFKKGFQPAAGHTPRPNMALGKDQQQQLQQGLLGEFERAQSRRLESGNRGAGLGFSAPSNKKFVIDINASRSVRFDD